MASSYKCKILNKCPKCGAELEYHELCQYTEVYRILKSGKVSTKRIRKEDSGSMEASFICCSNCDFHTDCDLSNDEYDIWNNKERFYFESKE